MASSEILSQTLYSITNIKLEQLAKQKSAYESAKQALLQDAHTHSSPQRVKTLVEGAVKLPAMTPLGDSSTLSLANLKRFIHQAEHDPSVSDDAVAEYERTVKNELDVHSEKYRFAELYGKLVKEWISSGKTDNSAATAVPSELSDPDSDSGSDSGSAFLPVGREEMHRQRATWEEYVFEPKTTDGAAIKAYLDSLFCTGSADVAKAFKRLRNRIKKFQKTWARVSHFDEATVATCIRGLLALDILSDQKRATLNDFLGNNVVLREIADVLRMRMQTRDAWGWEGECVVEQRRSLNGRYRFYPDEDLLQSIFLYYIGRSWGVQMRKLFKEFLKAPRVSNAAVKPVSKEDARRRRFFLGIPEGWSLTETDSLKRKLEDHWDEEILLDQLPEDLGEDRLGGYQGIENGEESDDDSDDEYGWGFAGNDKSSGGPNRQSHVKVVQNLLHILQAQIIMHNRMGKEVTVIRSDFKWFGPSLPHSSVFAVLEFLGLDASWIDFFRRVLECPLRFGDDPAGTPARTRKRGLPLTTPIAAFLAETLLFCLDLAVNQKADGARLYRLHDDMWLWGPAETCGRAWDVVTEFTSLFGLEIKTGSATVFPKHDPKPAGEPEEAKPETGHDARRAPLLPPGDVIWGFLKLDAATGRFLLDQAKVDEHIAELRLQIRACRSVFDFIQAWNAYGARFFATNFGALANCYSRAHVDEIVRAFARIQAELFPRGTSGGGGVGAHLKAMLAGRFGADDVPDGYLYLPVGMGGLGLQNPFVAPFIFREAVLEDPGKEVDKYLHEEKLRYEAAKKAFESPYDEEDPEGDGRGADVVVYGGDSSECDGSSVGDSSVGAWDLDGANARGGDAAARRRYRMDPEFADLRAQPFMSFEEYGRYRETTSGDLGELFERLRAVPSAKPLDAPDEVGMPNRWRHMSDYDTWVCRQHSNELVRRFGGLVVVEKGLLPMGLMGMLRQSRFRWQG